MAPDPSTPRSTRRSRGGRRSSGGTVGGVGAEDIQDAYQRRAIAEIAALNDAITGCERCRPDVELPVMSSGSPQAEIMLIKWSREPRRAPGGGRLLRPGGLRRSSRACNGWGSSR